MIDALIQFIAVVNHKVVIETLICHTEIELMLIVSTSFGFAQNILHDFQYTVFNSKWHCPLQMPQNPLLLTNPSQQFCNTDIWTLMQNQI